MKKTIYIILLITTFTSCRVIAPELTYKSGMGRSYFPTYDEDSPRFVIPDTTAHSIGFLTIQPNDSLNSFTNEWYSKHLYTLGEPVLYNKTKQKKNIIRFTHLGTWSNPFSYRLEQKGEKVSITFNKTKGLGGYDAGKRVKHDKKKIPIEKWDHIVSKMDSINFWDVETHGKYMVLDGEEWILEALIDGRYHFITRNSPDVYNEKEYAELCKLIEQIYNE